MTAPSNDLVGLLAALKQRRRDLIAEMSRDIATNPDRVVPSAGLNSMLAAIQGAIAAVGAVIVEDAGGGDEA